MPSLTGTIHTRTKDSYTETLAQLGPVEGKVLCAGVPYVPLSEAVRTNPRSLCYHVQPEMFALPSKPGQERRTNMKLRTLYVACAILVLGCAVAAGQANQAPARSTERITKEVRHELLMLPYLGVFDNLAYNVDGNNVTLMGQVTRPTLKSDAENVVKRIEGVEHIDNQIEVLPPSPIDES